MSLTLIYLCVVNLFYLLVTSESATWLDQPDHGIDSKPLLGKCMYVVSVTASWVNILSVQSRRLAGNTTHFGPKTPNAFVYLFVSNQACMYLWVVADLLLAAYYYEVLRILISPAAISIVFDAAWFFSQLLNPPKCMYVDIIDLVSLHLVLSLSCCNLTSFCSLALISRTQPRGFPPFLLNRQVSTITTMTGMLQLIFLLIQLR